MANSRRQTLEQGRAAFAFEKAREGWHKHKKEFSQTAKKIPMLVKTNGLGAAFAFMYAKQNVHGTILSAIDSWLNHPDNQKTHLILKGATGNNLVQKVTNLKSAEYRTLTIETMAFLQWLRRFAEGITKEEELKKKEEEKNKQKYAT